MVKNWKIKPPDGPCEKRLTQELGISEHLARLLINRSITTAEAAGDFLDAKLSRLHNPGLLPDIKKAAKRIFKALKSGDKVLIFSDYDADGITALAVLKKAFDKLGLRHSHYIGNRLKEGYGLTHHFVKYAHQKEADLVIALDCGIGNFKEIEELKRLDIDTIVVDHHEPYSDKLPMAYAVVDPKRIDSRYPYRDLAGVGLSYKLATFLLDNLLEEELDLVCLGTVADVVPLLGENRIIVKEGLRKLTETSRPGLRALIELAGIKNKKITTQNISYCLGPRINACGRLESAEPALDLLLCEAEDRAILLANELHSKNSQRQRIGEKIMLEVLDRVGQEVDFGKERVIVLSQDGWHQGVLGIVAAKVADRYHRPAIIISFENGLGRGSGRSIENFSLFETLSECRDYLQGFGGHSRAAGLSIFRKDVDGFKKQINKIAMERLRPEDLFPTLNVDLELRLADLSEGLFRDISCLEPFGQDNRKPIFASCSLKIKSKPLVLGRDTLKFWVSDGRVTYPAVGFGMAGYFNLVSSAKELDLAYRLSWDSWQGNNQLQLEIEDIRLKE